jgi:ABC-2 type transport system ATP-binding protein
VSDDELRTLESEFQVISTHLVGGQHEIRVFAPASPGPAFHAVAAELQDVYFLNLSRHANN